MSASFLSPQALADIRSRAEAKKEYIPPEQLHQAYPPPRDVSDRRFDEPEDPAREHAEGWKVEKKPTQKCNICEETCRDIVYICDRPACGTTVCKQCSGIDHLGAYKGGRDQVKNGCWCSRSGRFARRWRPQWYQAPPPRVRSSADVAKGRAQTSLRQTTKATNAAKTKRGATEEQDTQAARATFKRTKIAAECSPKLTKSKLTASLLVSTRGIEPESDEKMARALHAEENRRYPKRLHDSRGASTGPMSGYDSSDQETASLHGSEFETQSGTSTPQTMAQARNKAPIRGGIEEEPKTYIRNAAAEDESDEVYQLPPPSAWSISSPSADPVKSQGEFPKRPTDLSNRRTVIIGGGIMGCLIARELAQTVADPNHSIVVVEVLREPMSGASQSNSGIIDEDVCEIDNVNEGLQLLAAYSIDEWQRLAEDEQFRLDTCYDKQVFDVTISQDGVRGQDHHHAPWWFQSQPYYDFASADQDCRAMTVNPKAFAQWVVDECKSMEIMLYAHHNVTTVQSADGKAVTLLALTNQGNGKAFVLPCDNLIIAAGAWSDEVFSWLFKDAEADLNLPRSTIDWCLLTNPSEHDIGTTALRLTGGVWKNGIDLVARAADDQIWMCETRADSKTRAPVTTGTDGEPWPSMLDFAKKRLDFKTKQQSQLNMKSGREIVSKRASALPIITKLPPSHLGLTDHYVVDDSSPYGVFVCTGFGMNGLTLGFGAAKVISRLVRGLTPEINPSLFLPSLEKKKVSVKKSSA